MSRSCTRRLRRSSRTRSKSRGSSRGRITMSARSDTALDAERDRLVSVRSVASEPISVSRCAPMRPSASCTSMAFRSPQPSSSRSLATAASPGRSGGSAAAPAGSSTRKLTSGTAWCSTVHTRRPLESAPRRISGNLNGGSGLSDGSRERSTAITTRPPLQNRSVRGRRVPWARRSRGRVRLRHNQSRAARCRREGVTARYRSRSRSK